MENITIDIDVLKDALNLYNKLVNEERRLVEALSVLNEIENFDISPASSSQTITRFGKDDPFIHDYCLAKVNAELEEVTRQLKKFNKETDPRIGTTPTPVTAEDFERLGKALQQMQPSDYHQEKCSGLHFDGSPPRYKV